MRLLRWGLLLLFATTAAAQSKAGLLLTVAGFNSDGAQQFHSFWIVRDGGNVRTVEGNRLLVPRASGWWELGTTVLRRSMSAARSEVLWSGALGTQKPKVRTVPYSADEPCLDDINTYTVSWVGTEYATVQHAYANSCNEKSVSGMDTFMVSMDELARDTHELRPHLDLRDIAGGQVDQARSLGLAIAKKRLSPEEAAEAEQGTQAQGETWIVVRSKGRYRLLGTSPELPLSVGSFDIPIEPPASLVGSEMLTVGWDAVLDKVPDAVDAFTASTGNFAAVVARHWLSVYAVKDGTLDSVLWRTPIESPALVAARSVSGEEVDRWNETLAPALQQK